MERLSLLFAVVFGSIAQAQNLVPNSSFETLSACPENPGDIELATGWSSYRGSPDLYNECNQNGWYDVPLNAYGNQFAADGIGYIGLVTFTGAQPNVREFAGALLEQPLTPGVPVYLSLRVAVACNGWYSHTPRNSAGGIGIFFSTQPMSGGGVGLMPNWAAISLTSAPTDTLSWINVSGVFVPDSAYSSVVIGNPFVDALTDTATVDSSALGIDAIAFVDEVCVSYDPVYCGTHIGMDEVDHLQPLVFPNPVAEELHVLLPSSARSVTVSIHDTAGRIMGKYQMQPSRRERTLDVSYLPEGVYVLHVTDGANSFAPVRFVHVAR